MFEKIFFTSQQENYQPKSDCENCSHRICCVVFDIISEENQGRSHEIVKKGGMPCKHLGEHGCKQYNNRNLGPWKSCQSYECMNAWPILSHWMTANNLNILEKSSQISTIMGIFRIFLEKNSKNLYHQKIIFLEKFLENYKNPENFLQKIKNPEDLEWEFQKFLNS